MMMLFVLSFKVVLDHYWKIYPFWQYFSGLVRFQKDHGKFKRSMQFGDGDGKVSVWAMLSFLEKKYNNFIICYDVKTNTLI